jgi:N utilization substance protein B
MTVSMTVSLTGIMTLVMPAMASPITTRHQEHRMPLRAADPAPPAPPAPSSRTADGVRARRPARPKVVPRLETRARARALQALYAWDIRQTAGGGRDLGRVANEVWEDLMVPIDERRLAAHLVSLVADHADMIDRDLTIVTTNWRLERLGAIERSVLRLGSAELIGVETPPRVAIQEAVRLAERYGSVQSAKFVNGVLDALARHTGRL